MQPSDRERFKSTSVPSVGAKQKSEYLKTKKLLSIYDLILATYMPPSILVDRDGQVVHIFGDATRHFTVLDGRPPRPSVGLIGLLTESLRFAVSSALLRSAQTGRKSNFRVVDVEDFAGRRASYSVQATPIESETECYFLVVIDESDSEINILDREESPTSSRSALVAALEQDLEKIMQEREESVRNCMFLNEELHLVSEELECVRAELNSLRDDAGCSSLDQS